LITTCQLGLSLLVSPLFKKTPDDPSQADIGLRCLLSLFGFGLSMLEGYRIIFTQYHYHSNEQRTTDESNGNPALPV
jgi:hypothetical protein